MVSHPNRSKKTSSKERAVLVTIEKRRATYLRVVADGYWPRVIEIPRQASERPGPPPRAA